VGGIAKQRKIQFVLCPEVLQGFHGICTDPKNGNTLLGELRFCVAKLGRFDRSTWGVGLREKEQEDPLAMEGFERDFLAFVGSQGEFGSFLADFEHERVS
jgi:hypothetical protein